MLLLSLLIFLLGIYDHVCDRLYCDCVVSIASN